MRSTTLLAGLMMAATSTTALAATPSYDYIQLDYVGVNRHDAPYNDQGVGFQLSSMLAPYLIFDASYEYLQSDRFQQGLVKGRVEHQTISAGLEGRLPLVRNMLDGFLGADFVYADFKNREDFKGVYDDDYSNGYQVKGGVRANWNYFEVIPTVRYLHVFDSDEVGISIEGLSCPGYGICINAGYEYLKQSQDSRYFAGVRFNYD